MGKRGKDRIISEGFPLSLLMGGVMAWRHKLNSVHTLSSMCKRQGPPSSVNFQPRHTKQMCPCVVTITAYNVFFFPETVSTDVASWVMVTWSVEQKVTMEKSRPAVYLEMAFSAWCLWWLWACLSGKKEEEQEEQKGGSANRLDCYGDEKKRKAGSPGEILNVHQHGVLLDVQLISQQQQLHQLLVKTCSTSRQNSHSIVLSFGFGGALSVLCVSDVHTLNLRV